MRSRRATGGPPSSGLTLTRRRIRTRRQAPLSRRRCGRTRACTSTRWLHATPRRGHQSFQRARAERRSGMHGNSRLQLRERRSFKQCRSASVQPLSRGICLRVEWQLGGGRRSASARRGRRARRSTRSTKSRKRRKRTKSRSTNPPSTKSLQRSTSAPTATATVTAPSAVSRISPRALTTSDEWELYFSFTTHRRITHTRAWYPFFFYRCCSSSEMSSKNSSKTPTMSSSPSLWYSTSAVGSAFSSAFSSTPMLRLYALPYDSSSASSSACITGALRPAKLAVSSSATTSSSSSSTTYGSSLYGSTHGADATTVGSQSCPFTSTRQPEDGSSPISCGSLSTHFPLSSSQFWSECLGAVRLSWLTRKRGSSTLKLNLETDSGTSVSALMTSSSCGPVWPFTSFWYMMRVSLSMLTSG
mmetsp:Transcript_29071/g.94916  ORF Transcript_29071/g.94916 Transcript_29071/m.94916 type:complete len:416 (-) Transcript_29071:630-1877(-)